MADVLFDRVGKAGLITLNRPTALNALSHAMVEEMSAALDEWARDDRIERVAIHGEGKAFCAGGDIRAVYEARERAADFFAAEYRLNYRVQTFAKPYVALVDGIVMGGGVGVSMHGSHRVGGEAVTFAMPEVGIGLFPDVGARHVLAAMDGHFGRYLGLTGARLTRDAAADAGLITHPTTSERVSAALDRTAHARDLDRALGELTVEVTPRDVEDLAFIAEAFAPETPLQILERVEAAAGEREVAARSAEALTTKCPTSIFVTARALTRAVDAAFADVIVDDYRIVRRIIEGHDLYEGIRAVVIDKDNAPRWSPATLDAVDSQDVARHFDVPEEGDIVLPRTVAEAKGRVA